MDTYRFQFQHLCSAQINILLIDTFDGHFIAFVETKRYKHLFIASQRAQLF